MEPKNWIRDLDKELNRASEYILNKPRIGVNKRKGLPNSERNIELNCEIQNSLWYRLNGIANKYPLDKFSDYVQRHDDVPEHAKFRELANATFEYRILSNAIDRAITYVFARNDSPEFRDALSDIMIEAYRSLYTMWQ